MADTVDVKEPEANQGSSLPGEQVGRDELLGALDSEIAERESEVSRLGLSSWGLAGALVGAGWMTLEEIWENPHKLTETLLVFLPHIYPLAC
jgi:hypothetical protein